MVPEFNCVKTNSCFAFWQDAIISTTQLIRTYETKCILYKYREAQLFFIVTTVAVHPWFETVSIDLSKILHAMFISSCVIVNGGAILMHSGANKNQSTISPCKILIRVI